MSSTSEVTIGGLVGTRWKPALSVDPQSGETQKWLRHIGDRRIPPQLRDEQVSTGLVCPHDGRQRCVEHVE